jgi:hypothetical protein
MTHPQNARDFAENCKAHLGVVNDSIVRRLGN